MKRIITLIVLGIATISFAFSQSLSTSPLTPGQQSDNPLDAGRSAYVITHSLDQSIISGNSVACTSGGLTTDNAFIRAFDLVGEFGISEGINVTSVEFGVETAEGSGGVQPITVNIYTLLGPFLFGNMTLIASQAISLPDQDLTIVDVPINALIPAGSIMVVEVYSPEAGNRFWIGSNNLGQTAQSYLATLACGYPEPIDLGAIGFPDMHTVMNVYAESAQPVPFSNWALFLGIGLILAFTIIRFRKLV